MNTEGPTAKCRCRNCDGHIEFDPRSAGQNVTCPHCGMDTALFVPGAARAPVLNGRVETKPANRKHPGLVIAIAAGILLLCLLIYGMMTSEAVQGLVTLVGGGILALVLFIIGTVIALLWIIFPVFVYYALRRMEKVLEQIERNTRQP